MAALVLVLSPAQVRAQRSWQPLPICTTPPGSALGVESMVYDPDRQVTVYLAEDQGRTAPTWEFDGVSWTRRTSEGPNVRIDAAMAYDSARKQLVLLGGQVLDVQPAASFDDMWVYDGTGGSWQQKSVTRPPARRASSMSFDIRRERIVLFGGELGNTKLGDTWEWDGTVWREVTQSVGSPGFRSFHAMTYDPVRQVVVLFGGSEISGPGPNGESNETWEYDGTAWREKVTTQSPSGRVKHALVYDSRSQRVVLFGGGTFSCDTGGKSFDDSWEYDGTNWQRLELGGNPSARSGFPMVYDAARGRSFLVGGQASPCGGQGSRDTWVLASQSLTDTVPFAAIESPEVVRTGGLVTMHGLAGDADGDPLTFSWSRSPTEPGDGPPVVLAGANTVSAAFIPGATGTYRFTLEARDPGGSTARSSAKVLVVPDDARDWRRSQPAGPVPTARDGGAMAFDSLRGVSVLFGGSVRDTTGDQTWEYDGSRWSQNPSTGPTARTYPGLTFDSGSGRGRIVLFGGFAGNPGEPGTAVLADTWEYDGTQWSSQAPTATVTPARGGPMMTYDSRRRRTVLFGGLKADLRGLTDTWEYDGTTWTEIPTVHSPSPRGTSSMVFDSTRQVVVLFGGTAVDSQNLLLGFNDTWEYDGSDWSPRKPAASPGVRALGALVFDSTRRRTILFGGESTGSEDCLNLNGKRFLADTWEYDGQTWTPLAPAVSPDARGEGMMAYDSVRNRLVLFSGNTEEDRGDNTTWELPSEVTASGPAPVARIVVNGVSDGPPQVVGLDGSASTGDRLTYSWSVVSRPLIADGLSSAAAVVSYRASAPGVYVFSLAVSDGFGRSNTVTRTFVVAGSPPVARILTPPQVILRDPSSQLPVAATTLALHLDGGFSFDTASTRPVTYRWTLLEAPTAGSVTSTFALLEVTGSRLDVPLDVVKSGGYLRDAGHYRFGLTVVGAAGTASASTAVDVSDPGNLEPRADAGLEQTVLVRVARESPLALSPTIPDPTESPPDNLQPFIRLDGRSSLDLSGGELEFFWLPVSRPAGAPPIELSDSTSPTPTFIASAPGDYSFVLVVQNAVFSSRPSPTTIRIANPASASPPHAEAVVTLSGGALGTRQNPLVARAGLDLVTLDGTLSTDATDALLTYRWTQIGGRPVALLGGGSNARPQFVPPAPDRYVFVLVVGNDAGLESRPFELSLAAVSPDHGQPSVTVISSGGSPESTGEDFAPEDDLASPRSLVVTAPAVVTLSAYVRSSSGQSPTTFAFAWRQIDGPAVLLTPAAGRAGSASAVSFAASRSRVHIFELTGLELDRSGQPTGSLVRRVVRVAVDSSASKVPLARFTLFEGHQAKATFSALGPNAVPVVSPGVTITLNGSESRDRNTPERPLAYRWVQTFGPPVVLSNATSAITTFVVPELADEGRHRYIFQLFTDNGDRSEPVTGQFVAFPRTSIALGSRLDLLAIPVNPAAPGGSFDSADLVRQTSAVAVVRMLPGGRFQVYHPDLGVASFPVEGNRGYFVLRRGRSSNLDLSGTEWTAARTLHLTAGLNLVAYPPPIPSGATLDAIRVQTGARFVAQIGPSAKYVPYVQGLTGDERLRLGRGYVISVPADVTVTLPAAP
ncbi:MAG: hypothetical protein HYY25_00045 [Candidatus Wallbacteria bacterium]|nr:hypothetical protein [Candidatus Wallbacteria bacterium]